MFTGIVQTLGLTVEISASRIVVSFPAEAWSDPVELGESVSVNGCCLTVADRPQGHLAFDLSAETLNRTALSRLLPGAEVNLERAMRPVDRFGGHFVQGHVDGVGKVVARSRTGDSVVFRFRVPSEGDAYLIDKGSISIDGISLTVVNPEQGEFDVWVIPHTLVETTLGKLQVGDAVNVEYDVLAKHIEKLLQKPTASGD